MWKRISTISLVRVMFGVNPYDWTDRREGQYVACLSPFIPVISYQSPVTSK